MIYLASASPRRAELLRQIGVIFDIMPVDIDESPQPGEDTQSLVLRLCQQKAQTCHSRLPNMSPQDLVLAADTLIEHDGRIIGKPGSLAGCKQILSDLSGTEHRVLSGVTLMASDGQINTRLSVNKIHFRVLSADEIRAYCQSGEPMDKAGAYAIQGHAARFIKYLAGSYSSVMGLPLFETAQLLEQAGYRFQEN